MSPEPNQHSPRAPHDANILDQAQDQDQALLRILDQNIASAVARSGDHLACRLGCTQCCHGAFTINALDALRLRNGLAALLATDPHTANAVIARAHQYVHAFTPTFPGDPVTGLLGSSDDHQEAFETFADDAPCPALNPETGACDLYDHRPMTCRIFGPPVAISNQDAPTLGFSLCELCFTAATEDEIQAAALEVPAHLETEILARLPLEQRTAETVVAWALLLPPPPD